MMLRKSCLFLLICSIGNILTAQYYYLGTAAPMPGDCIQLTPDEPFSEGIAYYKQKLDLTSFFEIQFDLFFGDKDNGADGITFVIHNDSRGFAAFGQWGECMGYGRFNPDRPGNSIEPSIAIEFDTYQNSWQNDPACDHIAYLENGISRHQSYWNNEDESFNLEDGMRHDFRFRWNPLKKEISVFLDGYLVYEGQRDLINDVFQNQPYVIWGFTSSTGRAYNQQYFCLKRMVSLPVSRLILNNG